MVYIHFMSIRYQSQVPTKAAVTPIATPTAIKNQTIPEKSGSIPKPPKIGVYIRLDADIVERFKAGGKGWQTRINEALRAVSS